MNIIYSINTSLWYSILCLVGVLNCRKSVRQFWVNMKKVILDEICGTTKENFKNNRAFKEHLKIHEDKIYQCSQCPDKWTSGPENIFSTKKKLQEHSFVYHSSKITCDKCPKSFNKNNHLNQLHTQSSYHTESC